ncbi:hypothetical protein AB0P00_13625 [Microbacterium sp. NPDC077057]|uniref:hypothetical protein n=1 Tax=Microbacterium sp. NPDC077057 TaxID=3154763 RepID=UPI00343406A9
MATFDALDAPKHIKPELMPEFRKALADAEAQGQEVYSVIIGKGVPLMYSVRDKTP